VVVSAEHCNQVTIRLEAVIGSVELIRCKDVRVHCSGSLPVVQVDLSQGITVVLPSAEFVPPPD
jgi:hypothetical protein